MAKAGTAAEPRRLLMSALTEYASTRPGESGNCARFKDFLGRNDDAMLRSCAIGHVTGSAFVVDPAVRRTLLVHHRKLGKWLQPGGHCEPGETSMDAAVRETLEETGVVAAPRSDGIFDIDVHPIPARRDEPAHVHYDVRYLLVAEPGPTTVSEESRAVEWVDLEEAVRRNPDPSIARMASKALALGTGA